MSPRLLATLGHCACLLGAATAGAQSTTPGPGPYPHEFYFSRGIFTTQDGDDWGPRWAIDFPNADRRFVAALRRLTGVDVSHAENAVHLGDDRLKDFPFVYVVEAGVLHFEASDRETLREYLLAGGFLMIDDSWGTWAWENLVAEFALLFPDLALVDIPLNHPVFHTYYDIDELLQVPNVHLGRRGSPTHEFDGYVPRVLGIFDERGRLMVLVNWNTDLGDAWEWADEADYRLHYSNFAYRMGINVVIFALTH